MAPDEHRDENGWELEDDEEFRAAWDRTEAAAVDLLRTALPAMASRPLTPSDLGTQAG